MQQKRAESLIFLLFFWLGKDILGDFFKLSKHFGGKTREKEKHFLLIICVFVLHNAGDIGGNLVIAGKPEEHIPLAGAQPLLVDVEFAADI